MRVEKAARVGDPHASMIRCIAAWISFNAGDIYAAARRERATSCATKFSEIFPGESVPTSNTRSDRR